MVRVLLYLMHDWFPSFRCIADRTICSALWLELVGDVTQSAGLWFPGQRAGVFGWDGRWSLDGTGAAGQIAGVDRLKLRVGRQPALQTHRLDHPAALAGGLTAPPALPHQGVDSADRLADWGALELEWRSDLGEPGGSGRMKGELVEVVNVIRHTALFCLWASCRLKALVLDLRTDLGMIFFNRVFCPGNSASLRSSSGPFWVFSVQLVWGVPGAGVDGHIKDTVDVQSLDQPAAVHLLRFLFSRPHHGSVPARYRTNGTSLALSRWTCV